LPQMTGGKNHQAEFISWIPVWIAAVQRRTRFCLPKLGITTNGSGAMSYCRFAFTIIFAGALKHIESRWTYEKVARI
jgi:hypothetical protein